MFTFENLPFLEALAYWQSKIPVTRDEFDKLSGEAKTRAFAVSSLSKLDQVQAVFNGIEKALEEGQSYGQFKKEMLEKLPVGWRETPHRLENIFRTNIQTAYQVGRYQQLMKVTDTMGYWRYVAVADSRTRKVHFGLHGTVRRYDDTFWDSFYPPNGYRCRCTVQALSKRMMKSRGLSAGEGIPERVIYTDPLTGMQTPIVPVPDKGWDMHVGKTSWKPDIASKNYDERLSVIT